MSAVELVKLRKAWGDSVAVRDIDLAVGDGEFVAVLGPSGCGKSTTLLMLAGIFQPTAGDIRFDGARVNEVEARDRNVGVVFQSYALYPHMTAAANIGFPLRFKGVTGEAARERIAAAAALVQISDLLERRPAELSGGQQQRVALARAVVKEPHLLLLDEPLSNLDATLRLTMRAEIRALHRRLGVTTVLVTHDQIEATTMADRIVVMNGGRIEQIGTADDLYRRPDSLFVASFVGTPPINLIEATAAGNVLGVGACALTVAGDLPPRVMLGLRPEHVLLARDGRPATIVLLEPMGREILATLDTPLGRLRALIQASSGSTLREGDRVAVDFAAGDVLLFDAASERRLIGARIAPSPTEARRAARH